MRYSAQEVIQYVKEADVKFIRLAFCDVFGKQKNIAIMPNELPRAFDAGIAINAAAIQGFGGQDSADLFLHPDPATLTGLPWRPESGRVVRMFCDITRPDGSDFPCSTRGLLKKAVAAAKEAGCTFTFGSKMEFYLFLTDESGQPVNIPYDRAGYMDIAPEDKGENVRREICLTLEKMGIQPESSHHEEGPGQNEIDFLSAEPLTAADNAVAFSGVVKTIAARNGLWADFSPLPLEGAPGSGMHINISVAHRSGEDMQSRVMAGIMDRITDMTVFLNPSEASYRRLGSGRAPGYVSWSATNRAQLIRVPVAKAGRSRFELRSPDPTANPYIAFTLLIYAGLHGIRDALPLPESTEIDLYAAPEDVLSGYERLPGTLARAARLAADSPFIRSCLPQAVIDEYCAQR